MTENSRLEARICTTGARPRIQRFVKGRPGLGFVGDAVGLKVEAEPGGGDEKNDNDKIDVLGSLYNEPLDLANSIGQEWLVDDCASISSNASSLTVPYDEDGATEALNNQSKIESEDDPIYEPIFSEEECEQLSYLIDYIHYNTDDDNSKFQDSTGKDVVTQEVRNLRSNFQNLHAGSNYQYSPNIDDYAILTDSHDVPYFDAEAGRQSFDVRRKFNLISELFDTGKIRNGRHVIHRYVTAANLSMETNEHDYSDNILGGQTHGEWLDSLKSLFTKKVQWGLLSSKNSLRPVNTALKGQNIKKADKMRTVIPYRLVPNPDKSILRHESRYPKKTSSEKSALDMESEVAETSVDIDWDKLESNKSFEDIIETRIVIAQYYRAYNAILFSKRGTARKQELVKMRHNGRYKLLHHEQRLNEMFLNNRILLPDDANEGIYDASSQSSDESLGKCRNAQRKPLDQLYSFSTTSGHIGVLYARPPKRKPVPKPAPKPEAENLYNTYITKPKEQEKREKDKIQLQKQQQKEQKKQQKKGEKQTKHHHLSLLNGFFRKRIVSDDESDESDNRSVSSVSSTSSISSASSVSSDSSCDSSSVSNDNDKTGDAKDTLYKVHSPLPKEL